MGAVVSADSTIEAHVQADSSTNYNQEKRIIRDYDMQVIEVSNIALAIRNKQQTINVQLSLRCENLPTVKAFGSTDSMIVVLKSDENSEGGPRNFAEIGRTEVVCNETNPKYIKTFIFPFKGQTTQELELRVYHMLNKCSDDLRSQKLLGKVNVNLHNLVDSEKDEQQIKQVSKTNMKSILKLNCSEYDGGNSYYEVGIELTNFVTRTEIYYVIEAWKFGEWIPVIRSEGRKASRFKDIKVSYNKFQGEDNSGVRIKVYDLIKQQQIGSTKQFSIMDTANHEKVQTHRVTHSGFVVGTLLIHKWKKVVRDSFISYIVGGARLHLLLALDMSNSNLLNGQSLHTLDQNQQNIYINAIREIVGVLQYFSIQNQVALYGFGAKLPPFYRSVSQCFALNGNYFHPNVEGGVEEIVRLYKQNLQKVKMHGPTKISEILDLAIKYASEEEIMSTKTSTYYVLIIVTDGRINDYQDTVDLIVKASTYPLSILFVGVGEGDEDSSFKDLQFLDSETLSLTSSKTGKTCQRDIVDFIKISHFLKDDSKQALARETFAEIPNHFIDYMSSKNIKPMKEKKSLKAAKSEFIAEKIKSNSEKVQPFICSFLEKQKKQMKKRVAGLGLNMNDPMLEKMNISMNDLSYFIEVYSHNKKPKIETIDQRVQVINTRQLKKLQQYLDRKQQNKKIKTLEKLQKIEGNQYGKRVVPAKKPDSPKPEPVPEVDHPCVKCRRREIDMMHKQCGHCSACSQCFSTRCPVCYHVNSGGKKFYYSEQGELQCEASEQEN